MLWGLLTRYLERKSTAAKLKSLAQAVDDLRRVNNGTFLGVARALIGKLLGSVNPLSRE